MAIYKEILSGKCSTLLPKLHLRQIGLFLWRKGIELFPIEDDEARKAQLKAFWDFNDISHYFDDIWERGAKTGEILLYVKPLPSGMFRIRYFDKAQFDYEQDDLGLKSVTIAGEDSELVLTRSKVGKQKNPYGFVPCIVIQNRPTQAGRGKGEFEGYDQPLERLDWLVDQIQSNIEYFGGPLFYSSRSRSELLEAGIIQETRSFSTDAGYGSSVPTAERVRLRRVIAGLEPGEQIGFATPDAITPEVLRWITDYEGQLRVSLGSIPDGSRSYSIGDTDILSRFALPITTAERKAELYISKGIVKAFEMMFQMIGQPSALRWRWKGSIFPDSAQTQLTKSIVGRNLLRLGVNLEETLSHIFPELSRIEIGEFLEGGFAYELLSGVSSVISQMPLGNAGEKAQEELTNYILGAIQTYERSASPSTSNP